MNKLPIILLAVSFICTQAVGQHKQFDKNLITPRECDFSETLGKQSGELKKILDRSDLKAFYAQVQPLFDWINKSDRSSITKEELTDRIWSFYLICGAPLYAVDWKSGDPWPYGSNDEDIAAKYGIAGYITILNLDVASKNTGIPEKQLKKLGAVYFSAIIKTLRDAYVPGFKEKVDELIQQAFKTFPDDFHQVQNNQSKISILQSRNNAIQFFVPKLEGDFIEMLVKYYPDHANEVIKYIKLAGYKDGEISELFDRTVGRTPKTEYLYKGKIGKEHDKRVKG